MHHEEELSKELSDALKQREELMQQVGATGRFPDGRLTSTDQGEIGFAVTGYHGKVVVNFGKPVASLGMSVQQARDLALLLRKWANKIERTPGL